MKTHDRTAVAAYRSALAAIDNAEAVPTVGFRPAAAIEASEVGVGRTEVPRRELSEQEMIHIVSNDAAERRMTADALASVAPDRARALRHEADLLRAVVDDAARRLG